MIYKGKGGIQYNLEPKPFAQGGEGQIFNIVGKPNLVAKLYKDNISLGERERKLNVMVTYPPDKSVLTQIAWPIDVLYRNNIFVGFVMPKLKINEDLNVIYEYGATAKYPNIPWSNKIIIAKNLCAVLNAVHEAGHACGDLNPKNISVDPNTGHIVFVDTDSYHIQDGQDTYRCCVGIPEYLPVEIQKKMKGGLSTAALPTFSRDTDDFALAIHIFQLLMNGVHPFSCAVLPSQVSVAFPQPSDNIINGSFPFMQNVQGITIPKFAPPISILPNEIQKLFKRAFILGHTDPSKRPTAVEWYNALSNLEKNLKKCSSVNYHEFYKGLNSCPWCTANSNFNAGIKKAQTTTLSQSTIKQAIKPVSPPTTQKKSSNTYNRSSYSNHTTASYSSTYANTYTNSNTKVKSKSKRKLIIFFIILALVVSGIVLANIKFKDNNDNSENTDSVEQLITLSTPNDVRVSNGIIIWDNVENASAYTIKVNEDEIFISNNKFELDDKYPSGIYTISVMAKSTATNVNNSEFSKEISITKPSAPTGILINNNILSWNKVSDYSSYRIFVNNKMIDVVSECSYSIFDNLDKFQSGTIKIGISVSGDNKNLVNSNLSKIVTFKKLDAPNNLLVKDDILSWNSVTEATGYRLTITNKNIQTFKFFDSHITNYNLLGEFEKGDYLFSLQALGNGETIISSSQSLTCSYRVTDTIVYVNTKQDLINIGNDLTAKYILNNNIDISGVDWMPIGTISNRFNGALIGNGHIISGLTLTSKNTLGSGLFGVIGNNGKVNNLILSNVNISGGTTGYIGAVAGINYGTISNVIVSGIVGVANVGDNVGGLVGRSFGSIYNCTNEATVKGGNNVGGIAGNYESLLVNLSFYNCKNIGIVTGKEKVGGIVGYLRVSRIIYISKLDNSGDIISDENYVGGITGYIEGISGQTGNLESCLNSGNITGFDYSGGCFGYVGNYINITTSNQSDPSKECKNTGVITSTNGNHSGNIQGN